MSVDLSPGEWAGVMDVLKGRASQLREQPLVDDDSHELADDYDRIAGLIREHLTPLPALTPGEDGEDVTCQHVWTEADVAAMQKRQDEYVASMRALHGADARLNLLGWYSVPVAGEVCGTEVSGKFVEVDWRRTPTWNGDGTVWMGKSNDTSGIESSLVCQYWHEWEMPEVSDFG